MSRIRAWVELIHHLDAAAWPARNAAGEVPNATPFGIDELAGHGVDVRFRPTLAGPVTARLTRRVRARTDGVEWAEELLGLARRGRRGADVVLCWDEFTGIPAAALSRLPGSPPVLSGVQLLSDAQSRPAAFRRRAGAALRHAAGIFVQSEAVVPALRDEWGIPESRIHFVPFGVDGAWFRPGMSEVDRNLVATVGDDPHRDHPTLVEAIRLVHAHRPGTRLEVATQLPIDLPPELGTVHRGHLGPRRPAFYGSAAVVAVATSPNLHGSGMSVILEAMACGRPYVVTESQGLHGYLRDGEDGLVVPAGDAEALAKAIRELLDDPDRADEIGANGRARLERELTTDGQARRLAEVIRTTLSG